MGPREYSEWPTSDELERYAAHAAVAAQATAFLAHITTTVGLYATITGAAWGVVLGNTFGVRPATLLLLLGLHAVLSFGVAIGLWGMGNNFIQRLNFAQWLGVTFWPRIERVGRDFAWRGVPSARYAVQPLGAEALETFEQWIAKRKFWLPRSLRCLDYCLRYRALRWPTLRHQRLWALLPALAALISIVLFVQVLGSRDKHTALCRQAAATLSFPESVPISREAFERARYLFDKAGCTIARIHLQQLRGGS